MAYKNEKEKTTSELTTDNPEGISSKVLEVLNVSDIVIPEGNKPLECRGLRLRRLNAAPGAIITVHSHENRPAILSIINGVGMEIHNYHKGKEQNEEKIKLLYGNSSSEFNKVVHYAVNLSETDWLGVITFDFLDNNEPCNGKKYPQNQSIFEKLKKENDPFYANSSIFVEGAESSTPIFYVPLSEINFPKGSATLNERALRTRHVIIEAGKSLPEQNYLNRPTYVFVMEGSLTIQKSKSDIEILKSGEALKLINHGNATISNTSDTEKAVYITMELWDPADKNIL